jgi:hypothetical protein
MRLRSITAMALVTLAGCSDENSQVRGKFLSGCVQGGASKSICSCMFEKLEEKYSPAEMKTMNNQYGTPPEQLIEDVLASAMVCRTQG